MFGSRRTDDGERLNPDNNAQAEPSKFAACMSRARIVAGVFEQAFRRIVKIVAVEALRLENCLGTANGSLVGLHCCEALARDCLKFFEGMIVEQAGEECAADLLWHMTQ